MSTTVPNVTASVTASASASGGRKPWAVLVPVGALLGFLAFISIVGSFLFSYPLGGLLGYGTGVALDVGGVLMAFAAIRLPRGELSVYKLAVGVMGAEVMWSFYKVFIYGEHESSVFLAASVVALVLLRTRVMRRFVGAGTVA